MSVVREIEAEQNRKRGSYCKRARESGKKLPPFPSSFLFLGFLKSSENGGHRSLLAVQRQRGRDWGFLQFMESLFGFLVSGFLQNGGFDCTKTTLYSNIL